MTKDLVITGNQIANIISKAGDVKDLTFKTIDSKALTEIESFMPIVNRKVSAFQKNNSQTTTSLMSLNMVDSSPYRVLRQILAQVEKKRGALKETLYELEKKKISYKEKDNQDELSPLDELEMKKNACDIVDSQGHIEAALKELGGLKRRYFEILKNKDIPEDWDEQDFEGEEIKHHITSIFRNALRDRMQGSHNMGTLEYMHQFGINGVTAYAFVDDYLRQVRESISNGNAPSIDTEYEFFDKMYEIFKDEHKKAMDRLGLDNITFSDFLMKDHD